MTETKENDCFAFRPIIAGFGECFGLVKIQPGCGTVKCPFYKPESHYVRHEKDGEVYFTDKGRRVEI